VLATRPAGADAIVQRNCQYGRRTTDRKEIVTVADYRRTFALGGRSAHPIQSAGLTLGMVLLSAVASIAACDNGHGDTPTKSPQSLHPPASLEAPTYPLATNAPSVGAYTLNRPDRVDRLPYQLREVSGLTDVSDHELGCVQDEDGIIFVYDLRLRQISRQLTFGPPGDYEGLTRVGKTFFVLRSDGRLYEVPANASRSRGRSRQLGIPNRDNEGLGFDSRRGRLLIAPKARLKGKKHKDSRLVFAFELQGRKLLSEPAFELSIDAIREFAEIHGLPVPEKTTKKGKKRSALRFMPASIAVHPATQEIFVLSAEDHVLAAFDASGAVTGYARLDPKLFAQPEGITFLSNGDMVISNEGAGKDATLLLFKWRRQKG